MNWRRGLFRVWLAISILWICGTAAYVVAIPITVWSPGQLPNPQGGIAQYPWQMNWTAANEKSCFDARVRDRSLGNPYDCFDNAKDPQQAHPVGPALDVFLIFGLVPPLGLLIVAAACRWVFQGFRSVG
jgi:hypothetical protein